MKKGYLYIIGLVLLLGLAAYVMFFRSGSSDVQYRTERASRGDVVVQVRATGTINPVQTVQVGSQVSGTIAALYADFNSVVKKGQIIAQIDSTFLYAAVKEAEANLERIEAQKHDAERSFKRIAQLFKKGLVSQAELDAAQTALESSVAQLKQAQAALDRAKVNLRHSIIRSPIDGVVISRDVDVGQTVAASLQAPRLFLIANDLKRMQVEASVDEADIGNIREEQQVTFTVDAYPQENFRGTVKQVRLAPVTVQNVVTYTVIIDVPNPQMKLRPGMTATVSVLVDKRENVLRIPTLAFRFQPPPEVVEQIRAREEKSSTSSQTAIAQDSPSSRRPSAGQGRSKPPGSQSEGSRKEARIWILEAGKNLKSAAIQTGLNDNRFVEVVSGELSEGDEVIVGIVASTSSTSPGQTNPFQPRMPGGTRRM